MPPLGEWSTVMSMSACLSGCLHAYLRNYMPDIRQFLQMLPVAMSQSSPGGTVQYITYFWFYA